MRATILSLLLLLGSTTAFAQAGGWTADSRSACKVWNDSSQPSASVTWTGNCPKGVAQGHGTAQWVKDGKPVLKVEGEYLDGKLQDGQQSRTYANGDRYVGNYANGHGNGYGVLYWANGARYDGNFVNSKRQGHGTLTEPGGSRFEGEWNDGLPNGHGTYVNKSGATFTGNWTNGCLKNGERWAVFGTTKEACGFQ